MALTEEKFKSYVAAVNTSLIAPYETLDSHSASLWAEIANEDFMFDRKDKLIQTLASITLNDLKLFSGHYLFGHNTRKKLRFPS